MHCLKVLVGAQGIAPLYLFLIHERFGKLFGSIPCDKLGTACASRSRYLLTQEELLDFLSYLKSQPTHPNRKLLEAEPLIRHSQAPPGNEVKEPGNEG